MVDVDCLVPCELELSADLLAAEGLRFLLRHPDEDNSVPHAALPAHLVGDIVLPFLVVERVDRNRLALCFGSYRLPESLRHLSRHHRRCDGLARLFAHEGDQPA